MFPVVSENLPGAQSVQVDAAGWSEYLPGAQSVQDAMPSVEYVPNTHSMQTDSAVE